MQETRMIAHICGHKEEVTLYVGVPGIQGRSLLDLSFAGCMARECDACHREKINTKMATIKEIKEQVLAPPPSFIDDGYWNQKVYGRRGNRSIYIGGEKRSISEEEYNQWITYEKSCDEYKRIRDLVENMSFDDLKNGEYRKYLK